MHVIVHAGMPKTGSSAVQEYLAQSRSSLNGLGIDYPDLGHRGHWHLAAALSPSGPDYHHARRRLESGEAGQSLKEARHLIKRHLASLGTDADALILSHEDLSVSHIAKRLRNLIARNTGRRATVRFIAYVRHPVSLYTSAIQQALKSDRDRPLPPDAWLSSHAKRAQRTGALLGAEWRLRPFAPPTRPDWDVIDDFREFAQHVTGKDLPISSEAIVVNSSLSAEACAALEALRTADLGRELTKRVRRSLRHFDAVDPTSSKLALPDGWKDDIASTNAATWNETVAMLDCDPATRVSLAIEPRPLSRRYDDGDVHGWLLGSLNEEWLARYAAASADLAADPAVSAWLTQLREKAARAA